MNPKKQRMKAEEWVRDETMSQFAVADDADEGRGSGTSNAAGPRS